MYYTFRQNNTGAFYKENPSKGIGKYVIVQADNAEEANERAEEIGLYFHGVSQGVDCRCCGDRWNKTSEQYGTESPEIYGDSLIKWANDDVYVHYKNGAFVDVETYVTSIIDLSKN